MNQNNALQESLNRIRESLKLVLAPFDHHMLLQEDVNTLQAALDGLQAALSSNPVVPPEDDPEGNLS